MSFTLDMSSVLQYAFNLFGSFLPMAYLYLGAGVALYILFTVIDRVRGKKDS
ncbi:hypothetical protein [Bacillus sp. FJAT-27264]|uniref:hypothetical protein n=1 Tax=Paenibacillus sp. (strain DSM 101736 / FJAT-27264) TaxID=1850362 RepID=UPI0015861A89|nr:hypothetical protein [Bacillus sp. FJAT-27264]